MKALFLAGGLGTRLKPLTDKLPKPMVPIMNKPLLERTMLNLIKCGITEVVISTCYQPEYIKNYFGDGKDFNLKIEYIVEDSPMGTGGAIKLAQDYFEESFVVYNSDIISDINLNKMIDYHKSSQAVATIAVTQVKDPSMYGVIEYDSDGYAISFKEKPKPGETYSKSINAGIYIFEPEIFQAIDSDGAVSIEREIFPKLLEENKKIGIYQSGSYWMDIGNIEKYTQTHKDIMAGKCRLIDFNFNDNNIYYGKNVEIQPDSEIIGPAYIGDNVTIGAKALIRNSVIGNNVSIGANSKVIESILWDDVIVSKNVKLLNTIVSFNSCIDKNISLINTVYDNEIIQPYEKIV
ncbi:MAG: NDP-sugar synthase [Anaerocolumna sp.]